MAELTIKEIKKVIDAGFEKQALMIKRGFDDTASKTEVKSVESRLAGVEDKMLKVHDRLRTVEDKLDRVLYKEIDRLEIRIKQLEQHVGLKIT